MTATVGGDRAGVTLIELVTALLITGMIAAIGTAAFDSVVTNRSRARAVLDATTRAAATRAAIAGWLSSARVSSDAQRPPTLTSLNLGEPDDALVVVANTPTPLDFREVVVHLYIDRDDATPESGLVAELQSLESPTMTRTQVDSSVTGLLVEYLDPQTNRWIPRTEGAIRGFTAVRLTLSTREPDTLPPLLRLPFVQAIPRQGAR